MIHWKETELSKGKTLITSEKGNSMEPLISSGQKHKLIPCHWMDCIEGNVVFCKVSGRYYTHLVTAKDKHRGLQISNNKGNVNGWTTKVFGKVVEVY